MINDDAFNWLMMTLAVVWVVIWLFGCAAEPRRPIDIYREQYGFTP